MILVNLVQFSGGVKLTIPQAAGNVTSFLFLILMGVILNGSWILTTISMVLTLIGYLTFYAIYLNLKDVVFITLISSYVILCILTVWFIEKQLKLQFIQMYQIKTMNEELTQILNSLPEGIILYSKEQKKVALVNSEFQRLFIGASQNAPDLLKVQTQIDSLHLKEVNFMNQEISSTCNQQGSGLISLIQASEICETGKYYQIISGGDDANHVSSISNDSNNQEVISLSKIEILFQNISHTMVMIKNLTPIIKYEKIKVQNHFYEMLTATVSHDLRTPLNSMIGLLSNIDQFISDPEGKRFVGIIRNSSQFMLFLVNDLLDYFQIKNGKFRKNQDWHNVNDHFKDLFEMFRIGTNEKGLQLLYDFSPNIPSKLYVDVQRLKQVVLNLLQNALKFTFHGYIKVEVNYNSNQNQLVVSVRDSGIGIPEDEKEKLFTLFGKLESTAYINTSGIGLGLNICKQIVEAFDGKIFLEECEGQGTKFTFNIKADGLWIEAFDHIGNQEQINSNRQLLSPRNIDLIVDTQEQILEKGEYNLNFYEQHSIEYDGLDLSEKVRTVTGLFKPNKFTKSFLAQEPQNTCLCSQKNRILVVDDNVFNIVTLQTILDYQLGFKSDKAGNGYDALQVFKEKFDQQDLVKCNCDHSNSAYKVIFMDCNMPIMDGFQATKEIRKCEAERLIEHPNYQRAFIVALTAYSVDLISEKCKSCGMDDFLTKPVSSETVKLILQKAMIV